MTPIPALLVSVLMAAPPLPAAAASSGLTVREISPARAAELKAIWSDAAGSLRERSRNNDNELIVPFFVVDTTSGAGVTTLFAVQGDPDTEYPVDISYEDLFGNVFRTETRMLAPSSVLTVNVRDKNPPVVVNGLAIGRVSIVARSQSRELPELNGDYFQVDPGANFGHGDGLVSLDDRCVVEDVRYATGAPFDDTVMMFHFSDRTTPAMGGETAAVVELYAEGGALRRTFELLLPNQFRRVEFITAKSILDQLGGGPAFGTMRFSWNGLTVGSAVTKASTSAQGRFSVGLQAACRANRPTRRSAER